jgi:hypothetical protein
MVVAMMDTFHRFVFTGDGRSLGLSCIHKGPEGLEPEENGRYFFVSLSAKLLTPEALGKDAIRALIKINLGFIS